MSTFVDSGKSEIGGLFDLSVDDVVGSGDVHISRGRESRSGDLLGDDFVSEPVAVVICVPGEHDDVDSLIYEFAHCGYRADFAVIVSGAAEGTGDCVGGGGEVYESSEGGLDDGGVEVVDEVGVWKGVWSEFSNVVFISKGDVVENTFDFAGAHVVCGYAHGVDATGVTVHSLVVAVPRTVHVVVHHGLDGFVEGFVVVCVSREDGEVVESCVLDQRIIPAVSNEKGLEVDVFGAWEGTFCDERVLRFEVCVEDGTVVASVGFRGEVEVTAGVLGESTHKSLEGTPHAGSSGESGVCSIGGIWSGVRPA